MSDLAISAATSITGANTASGDLLPLVDISASTGAKAKSITRDELGDAMTRTAALIAALSAKANLNGDTFTGGINFSGTTHAGVTLNSLTTTQRDALTPVAGMAIFNTTTGRNEFRNASTWQSFARLTGDTFSGALTITPSAANAGVLTANGTVTGGGITRALFTITDNWAGATGGTSSPRLFDLNINDTGGSLNYSTTAFMRMQRNGSDVFRLDHGGNMFWGSSGMFVDINNLKFQVPTSGHFSFAGDVLLYRRAANHLGLGAASATPSTQTVSGADGSGTNIAGGKVCLGPGRSTGSATPGVIALQGTSAGSSGTSLQSLVDVLTIVRAGVVRITGIPTSSTGLSTGDIWSDAGTLKIV